MPPLEQYTKQENHFTDRTSQSFQAEVNEERMTGGKNNAKVSSSQMDSITSSGVDQGHIGDCFFESALSSLANSKQGQQSIKDMIKQNSDQSYTVTFPGDKSSPINVSQKDLETNRQNGQVVDKADWARVIENAFLKYDHAAQYNDGLNNKIQLEGIPSLGTVACTGKAVELLTGEKSFTDSLSIWNLDNREITIGKTSTANVGKDLEKAFRNGEVVTASAAAGILSDGGINSARPLVAAHVYSVLSYDPKTQEVVVRNPWGSNNGTFFAQEGKSKDGITSRKDGELKMSLDTFSKHFTDVNISGDDYLSHNLGNTASDIAAEVGKLGTVKADILSGKISKDELKAVVIGNAQIGEDLALDLSDSAERAGKQALAAETNLASKVFHKAKDVTTNLIHNFNPLMVID